MYEPPWMKRDFGILQSPQMGSASRHLLAVLDPSIIVAQSSSNDNKNAILSCMLLRQADSTQSNKTLNLHSWLLMQDSYGLLTE